jgi:hypothetical protein
LSDSQGSSIADVLRDVAIVGLLGFVASMTTVPSWVRLAVAEEVS